MTTPQEQLLEQAEAIARRFWQPEEKAKAIVDLVDSQLSSFVALLKEKTKHSVNRGMKGQIMLHEFIDDTHKEFRK